MLEPVSIRVDEICGDPAVREQLSGFDARQGRARRRFWLSLVAGLLLGLLILVASGWSDWAWLPAFLLPLLGWLVGLSIPGGVVESLRRSVLDSLVARSGMELLEEAAPPPVYVEAAGALFGRLRSEAFEHLIRGEDAGFAYAMCEARLGRRRGNNGYFWGDLYAAEGRRSGGTTAIVPKRRLRAFSNPSGLKRVRLESDHEFERRFDIYSTSEMEARQLLFDSAFRARLLQLAEQRGVGFYAGPGGALLAVANWRKRFDIGPVLRRESARERVQHMAAQFSSALALLRMVRSKAG